MATYIFTLPTEEQEDLSHKYLFDYSQIKNVRPELLVMTDYTKHNAKIAQEFWRRVEHGEHAYYLWKEQILFNGDMKKMEFPFYDFDSDKYKFTWKPETKKQLEFVECDACSQKPGNPVLCDGCLNNRAAISKLKKMIEVENDET